MEREKEKVPWYSVAFLGFYREGWRVMDMLLSIFEGMCNLTLGAVITVCGFDPEEFEEES